MQIRFLSQLRLYVQNVENWNGSYSRLLQITQDTLLITGTKDIVFPPRNSFIIAEQIPGAWLVQFKGGGHGLMFQYPENFSSIVLYCLKRSSTACSWDDVRQATVRFDATCSITYRFPWPAQYQDLRFHSLAWHTLAGLSGKLPVNDSSSAGISA